jgi:DtxR family Mn-dependent transcriptional regulator
MPSLTVENYLKASVQIATETGSEWISTGQLAEALCVSPGTVTSMLKTLDESGLATYKPYEGVRLTEAGQKLALRMLRRHRIIELFLVNTLDLSWDQVHEEAENMEHAVSDFLIDRIDDYLGHPETDPHGDPIPAANGEMRGTESRPIPLTSCKPGTKIKISRVTNQGTEFLRYLSTQGLEVGAIGFIEELNYDAGIVTTQWGDRTISMGIAAAEQLLVEPLN